MDAENKGVPRLTAVKIHVCPTTYMYVVFWGLPLAPSLKRGFGLQSCLVLYEYRDEDARSAAIAIFTSLPVGSPLHDW